MSQGENSTQAPRQPDQTYKIHKMGIFNGWLYIDWVKSGGFNVRDYNILRDYGVRLNAVFIKSSN